METQGVKRWVLIAAGALCLLAVGQFAFHVAIRPRPLFDATFGFALATLVLAAALLWAGSQLKDVQRTADIQTDLLDHLGATMTSPRVVIDREGRCIWMNGAAREKLPLSLRGERAFDEMKGRLRLGAEGAAALDQARANALAGASPLIEVVGSDLDGVFKYYAIHVFAIAAQPGVTSWLVQDITEARQLRSLIADEQAKVVSFVDNAPVGFYSVDADGRFLFANATLARWLGVTPEVLIKEGTRLHDILRDVPPAGVPAFDAFADGDGSSRVGDVMLIAETGGAIAAQISQVVVAEGGPVRVRAIVRDLTAERTMAEALARTERGFSRFFEEAPAGIAIADPNGQIIETNSALGRLLGRTRESLLRTSVDDLVREDDRAALHEAQARATSTAEPATPAIVRLARSGTEAAAAVYVSRHDGDVAGNDRLILYFLDQTEQKRLEHQFGQSMKMQAVGQLAGGVAHDFNNLLTAMVGFCDLLLLRHKPGDPSFADIMQIKQNANRAANLVRQLLAFSRQQTLQPKVLDLTDVIAEISHLLRRLIGANIELAIVHDRDLRLVRADQGQIEQVIINLAVNARDAMPGGGKLTIRTRNVALAEPIVRGEEKVPAGDHVAITVEDAGTGIAPEHLPRIFEPFFSTKAVGSGTGLGLSTVFGIVKQTGGFIFVDSTVGKGTTFTIYLPAWREQRDAAAVSAKPVARVRDLTGAGTVLLVEDEDAVRLFGARALRNKGYKVVEAANGEAALELLGAQEQSIDLMVTDVVMPQMDGTQLIRIARERRPQLKIVCISGYAEETFRQRLDTATDIHFLPKPFTLDQLAGKVKEVLAG
jgi:two-component system cell cycle sensor histidine kinase/response regulator CckA